VLRCERVRRKAAVLTRLLRSVLRQYVRQVTVVVILLVAQTIGNLYRPNLNADVINYGVERGTSATSGRLAASCWPSPRRSVPSPSWPCTGRSK
jgi:hypothetical protein